MATEAKTALQAAEAVPGTIQDQLNAAELVPAATKIKTPFLTAAGSPRAWILYYRYGNIPQLQKTFMFDGHVRDVIVRARKHCEVMGFRYLLVRPFMVDLDYQEDEFIRTRKTGEE